MAVAGPRLRFGQLEDRLPDVGATGERADLVEAAAAGDELEHEHGRAAGATPV
jgi:hypothetical protein